MSRVQSPSKSPRLPVVGRLFPDEFSIILGTGYSKFQCEYWDGLAKVSGDRIDILVICTKPTGAGYFRKFIFQLKDAYGSIYFWSIENPVLKVILHRYGFSECHQLDQPIPGVKTDKEIWVDGMCFHHEH